MLVAEANEVGLRPDVERVFLQQGSLGKLRFSGHGAIDERAQTQR